MRAEDGIYIGETGREKTLAFIIPSVPTSYKLTGKGRKVDETLRKARTARDQAALKALVTT